MDNATVELRAQEESGELREDNDETGDHRV